MRGSVKMGVKATEIDANNRCERGDGDAFRCSCTAETFWLIHRLFVN